MAGSSGIFQVSSDSGRHFHQVRYETSSTLRDLSVYVGSNRGISSNFKYVIPRASGIVYQFTDRESESRILRIFESIVRRSDRPPIVRLVSIRLLDREQTFRTCSIDLVGPLGTFGFEFGGRGPHRPC
ncbi:hypothetical protein L3X38_024100 [Prunus dulcis]|uniref:Uncharacterized protein n=1 Tax=Prunus dulcis TaxID=3755 RepID=A0AAD4Z547_PRUDU|nr:hypothetical protein L3X38_024100 [Prunus dulcis]